MFTQLSGDLGEISEFESRAQFAARYKAVTNWQKALEGKRRRLFSVELQPLLARTDGRPILVFASLKNVSENNGRAEVYFGEEESLESRFKLELDCSPDQAHSFMSDESAYLFEVIAQIRSVESVQGGDYSLATGLCLDVLPVSMMDYFELVVGPQMEKKSEKGG